MSESLGSFTLYASLSPGLWQVESPSSSELPSFVHRHRNKAVNGIAHPLECMSWSSFLLGDQPSLQPKKSNEFDCLLNQFTCWEAAAWADALILKSQTLKNVVLILLTESKLLPRCITMLVTIQAVKIETVPSRGTSFPSELTYNLSLSETAVITRM